MSDNRAATEARIRDLRERARRLYEAAQHADSRQAYNEDRESAARMENEANELTATLQDDPT